MVWRVVSACLRSFDADHGDTARHYGQEQELDSPEPRWAERLKALDHYVSKLAEDDPAGTRTKLRQDIYEACRSAPVDPAMRACDSPVGTGKTTAVMAHLLNVALAKKLRHIFVVLPYTNIIKQSVERYQRALVLPDENPDEIIAETSSPS